MKHITRNLDKNEVGLIVSLLDLTVSIVKKYNGSYQAGIEGMIMGLKKYKDCNRQDTKIDLYLVWYIRTAVE